MKVYKDNVYIIMGGRGAVMVMVSMVSMVYHCKKKVKFAPIV